MINELSNGILRYHFKTLSAGLICELTNFQRFDHDLHTTIEKHLTE